MKRDDDLMKLRVQHEDDLWVLSQLVKGKSKTAGMLSYRRDQTTGTQEGGRAKAAERKPMWIEIKVENSEFQMFTDSLRLHGIISEAPIDKGSFHTHNVGLGDEIDLISEQGWSHQDEKLLSEAAREGGRAKVGIVVVEADEIVLFQIASHGMRDLATFTLRGGGKREKSSGDAREGFFLKAAKESAVLLGKESPLVICGPGLSRQQFEKLLRANGLTQDMMNVATNIGGRPAANEVLAEGLADEILGETAIAKQTALIDEALKRMATDGAVAYGYETIIHALEQGAIETLVVNSDLVRSDEAMIGDESWHDFLERLDEKGAHLVQASIEHDAGQQLNGLGGAIALLRWKID
ncbi:MAG: pelota family protein [Euryarchaeota archaeon]|nr:pelota family protein [Euryarchaeota archaeon]